MWRFRRALRPVLVVLLPTLCLGLLSGCLSPSVKFVSFACERVQKGRQLESVRFRSTIRTRGLAGEQVVYRIGLVNSAFRPIKSANKRFQNTAGNVAASRALLVHDSPWVLEDVSVTIPATELEIHADDVPVLATFGLYRPDGECLAQEMTMLPVYSIKRARRASTDAAAPPEQDRETRLDGSQTVVRKRTPRAERGADPAVRAVDEPDGAESAAAETTPTEPTDLLRTAHDSTEAWVSRAIRDLVRPDHAAVATQTDAEAPDGAQAADSQPVTAPPPTPTPATAPSPPPVKTPPPDADVQPTTDQTKPATRRYVVERGDTLSHIAMHFLGDASRWPEIYALNRDRLTSPNRLPVGTVLQIPVESAEEAAEEPEP